MDYRTFKAVIENEAGSLGVKEYEIYAKEGTDTTVETLNGEINAFSSGAFSGICLRVSHNGRMGYAATELMEEGEMRSLVHRALENAKATEKPDEVGIYPGADSYEADGGTSGACQMEAAELKSVALKTAKNLYSYSDKVTGGTATAAQSSAFTVRISNSHGLDLETSAAVNVAACEPVISDGEAKESAYELIHLDDGADIEAMARQAVDTALSKLGAGEVKSGKYNVVIDSRRMRMLLSAFVSVFSAKNAQMGLSLLKGKEGEMIASEIVTITDDPMREGACVMMPFDAEGVPTRRKNVVKNGVLQTLLYNRETAKRENKESTGNASKAGYASPVSTSPYAFCIESGDKTLEELYALAGDGILITKLTGLHAGANATTGDFSLESAGFMIRGGKVCEPVKSFTVAGNFFELLKSIAALSDTVELSVTGSSTTFGSPYVLVRDMSVAGE